MIETSLKFTQIIRILVLVTPLGCHPISFSCCVIRKNAKTYYHSYVIIIGATDMFCHKNALLLYFLMKQVSFLHRTIHWSDAKSVTSNCWHGKLNIKSMPITRTLANLNTVFVVVVVVVNPSLVIGVLLYDSIQHWAESLHLAHTYLIAGSYLFSFANYKYFLPQH